MPRFNHHSVALYVLYCCLCFIKTPWCAYGASILAIPMPFASHVYPLVPIEKQLRTKYNHTITIVLPETLTQSPLLKDMRCDTIIAKQIEKYDFSAVADRMLQEALSGYFPWLDMVKMFFNICEHYLSDEELMHSLKLRKFDMVLMKDTMASECMNYIPYKLSLPFMYYGNTYDADRNGIPHNTAFIPDSPLTDFSDSMNFVQRLKNFFINIYKNLIATYMIPPDLSAMYVPDKPLISASSLRAQMEMNLLDTDVLMDYPRPSMPNTIFVGGLNTGPALELPPYLTDIMNSAEIVVVMSFGSFVKSFPDTISNKLFESMKRFQNITFIMRHGKEVKKDGNIFKFPWIPQNDLLGHKNTKAFVTHGGHSSQFEALYHGVPMIGLPICGDQFYNAERMRSKGYGLYIKLISLEVDSLSNIIHEVVFNPKYKRNIAKASSIFHSRPETPSERAAFWIDHVVTYGGQYMQSKGMLLPWYSYYSLDVYVFIFVSLICICTAFIILCKKITIVFYVLTNRKIKKS